MVCMINDSLAGKVGYSYSMNCIVVYIALMFFNVQHCGWTSRHCSLIYSGGYRNGGGGGVPLKPRLCSLGIWRPFPHGWIFTPQWKVNTTRLCGIQPVFQRARAPNQRRLAKSKNHPEVWLVCWFRSCGKGWWWPFLFFGLHFKFGWRFCKAETPSKNF